MGQHPLTDEQCREALRLADAMSQYEAGAQLGISRAAFQNRLRTARKRGLHLSDGVREAIDATGLRPAEAKHGWKRVQDQDTGNWESVFWKAPEASTEDVLADIRAAFEGMAPAGAVAAPADTVGDLCAVYPLFDVHWGMHAWAPETGGPAYDVKRARADLLGAFGRIVGMVPDCKQALLVIGGDFYHADDERAETPASKHKLDVDGRQYHVLDQSIGALGQVIESLLRKHEKLTIRVLRGNHDEHSHLVLSFGLAERYRNEPRIEVVKEPRAVWWFQWGQTLLAFHHGDKMKPEQMAMMLADVVPVWSMCRHRFAYTGHFHHERSRDVGGLRWESLRAFCPADAYAASMGFTSRRALTATVFHKDTGRAIAAFDPIERPDAA